MVFHSFNCVSPTYEIKKNYTHVRSSNYVVSSQIIHKNKLIESYTLHTNGLDHSSLGKEIQQNLFMTLYT